MKKVLTIVFLTVLIVSCNENKLDEVINKNEELESSIERLENELRDHKHLKIGDTHEGGIIFYLDETGRHGKVCSKTDIGPDPAGLYWYAAKQKIEELSDGGHEDWYLPSKEELNLMWTNLADSDGNQENTGPDDPGNIGGFAAEWYWSSTEINNIAVWSQLFMGGPLVQSLNKDQNLLARACRAF